MGAGLTDGYDRRAFSPALTDKGGADLEKITAVVIAQDQHVVRALDADEQKTLHRLLLNLCGVDD